MAKNSGYSPSNPNLTAEVRPDSNGHLVTRWVKGVGAALAGRNNVALAAPSAGAKVSGGGNPLQLNWNNCSEQVAVQHVSDIIANADDKDALWENFDALTSAAGSKHRVAIEELVTKSPVSGKLRDAWLSKHGADLSDSEDTSKGYRYIKGDEGYSAYKLALHKLDLALKGTYSEERVATFERGLRVDETQRDLKLARMRGQ